MPAPIGYGEVTWRFTGTAVPLGAAIVCGFENVSDLSASTLAQSLRTAWLNSMPSSQTNEISMVETLVKLGPPDTGASASYGGAAVPGTSSGTACPPNVSFLGIKNTALGGRRGKGRLFLPGVSEGAIDQGGNVSGAFVTQFQSDLNVLLTEMDAAGAPMVLLHGPTHYWILVDGKPRQVPDVPYAGPPSAVVSMTASSVAATQRRRLRR